MPVGTCVECKRELEKSAFSGTQWKNGTARRRCLTCVQHALDAERAGHDARWSAAASSSTSTPLPISHVADMELDTSSSPQQTAPIEPFSVGSPGPSVQVRKKKGGRPRKAPEEKAVQGTAFRCVLDVTPETAQTARKALQTSLEGIDDVEKLALRQLAASSAGSNAAIEAFVGVATKWSNVQLARVPGLPAGVRWERVVETQHRNAWAAVKADYAFLIIRPEEDALESVRRGLQPGLHVQPAWIAQHVPGLQDVTAQPASLSPGGTTATRRISASVPTPSGVNREVRSASIAERPRPPAGESRADAAARADANREQQERKLLSLDPAAAQLERDRRAAGERARRGAEAMRARKERLRALLADAQLLYLRPQCNEIYFQGNRKNLDGTFESDMPIDVVTSNFIAWAGVMRLLRPRLDEASWLIDLLIPSLHCYLQWFSSASIQSGNRIDCLHAMHAVTQNDLSGVRMSLLYNTCACNPACLLSRLYQWLAADYPCSVFQRGRSVEEDCASDIAWGLCCDGGHSIPEFPPRPGVKVALHDQEHNLPWLGWLSTSQIESIVDDTVEMMIDDTLRGEAARMAARNGCSGLVTVEGPSRWSCQRVAGSVRLCLRDHCAMRLSPEQARMLCASAARAAQEQLAELEEVCVGASVTLFGFESEDALQYNGHHATVIALSPDRYTVRVSLPPQATLHNVARANLLFRMPLPYVRVVVFGSTPSKLRQEMLGEYHQVVVEPAPGNATPGGIYRKEGSPDVAMWREAGGRWLIGRYNRIGQGRASLRAFSSPISPLGIDNWEVWDGKMWLRAPRLTVRRVDATFEGADSEVAHSESEAESEAESEVESEAERVRRMMDMISCD